VSWTTTTFTAAGPCAVSDGAPTMAATSIVSHGSKRDAVSIGLEAMECEEDRWTTRLLVRGAALGDFALDAALEIVLVLGDEGLPLIRGIFLGEYGRDRAFGLARS